MEKTILQLAIATSLLIGASHQAMTKTVHETFDKEVIDTHTWNLYPEWTLTQNKTLKAGNGKKQKNQYLLPVNEWELEELAFKAGISPTDIPGSNAIIMIYFKTGAWLRMTILKNGIRISVKKDKNVKPEHLPFVPYAKLKKNISDIHDYKIICQKTICEITIDGINIGKITGARFSGPANWKLVTYHCDIEIDEITVKGLEIPKRLPIIGAPLAEKNYQESTKDRFYADGVTDITKPAKDIDLSPAEKLAPLKSWWFGKPDFKWDEFSDDNRKFQGKKVVDVLIGVNKPKDLLWRLRWFEKKKSPEIVRFYFKVPESGVYTVKVYIAGAKNLANFLHCSVDGNPLMRDIIRGANPKYIHSIYREHFPVKLPAGPHVLELKFEPRQSRSLSYMHGIALDAVGLEPENIPLVYEDSAVGERPLNEIITAVQAKRTIGRDFHYRIKNIPEQDIQVELTFHQPVTEKKGFAVFDVMANGKKVLEKFDIAAENGSNQPITRTFEVSCPDGLLDLHFKAEKGRALVNQIKLLDRKGRQITALNCGTSPDKNYGFMGPADMNTKWKKEYGDYKPTYDCKYPAFLRHLETNLFDGPVNIVVDPGFEFSKSLKDSWRPIKEVAPPNARSEVNGNGNYTFDYKDIHNGKRSIKIWDTKGKWGLQGNQSLIDWTRPYKFAAWVKGKNVTGENYLEVVWSKPDGKVFKDGHWAYDGHGSGLCRGGVRIAGKTTSQKLNGTFDWKLVSVRGYPPKGATVAAFRLRSDNNSGTIWFDDLRCEGYGDLPVEIIASQLGYHLNGQKEIMVLSQTPLKDKLFSIIDTKTGKQSFNGKLKGGTTYKMLNRLVYIADFSDLKKPGRYCLTLKPMSSNDFKSTEFTISDSVYVDLLRSNAFYYYVMREGMEIPGYHKASHLDDALIASSFFDRMDRIEGYKDLVGGWIDAGDYGKFNLRVFQPVFCLADAAKNSGVHLQNLGGKRDDLTEETMWGADYLVKCDLGNGLLHGKVNGGFMGGFPGMPPSLETDQNPKTIDGQGRTAAWIVGANIEPALAMSKACLAVRDTDPGRGWKYLQLAEKNYRNCSSYWDNLVDENTPDWKQLAFQPRALWTACLLYKATGNPKYKKEAIKRLKIVLPLIKNNVHESDEYYWGRQRTIKGNNFPWDYLHALMEFVATFPENPEVPVIKSELKRVIDGYVMKFNSRQSNPFGAVENIMGDKLWYYPEANYTTEFYPKTAWVLARAGNMFNRKDWLNAAERNIQWMTGMNHLNGSYVSGYGNRQFAIWSGLMNIPGLHRGILPGAITKGFSWGYGRILWNNRHLPNGYGMPRGFAMCAIHDGNGWYPHAPTAGIEIWEQFPSPIIAACAELNKAYSPSQKGDKLPPLPMGTENLIKNSGFENLTDTTWIKKHRPKWEVVNGKVPSDWDFNGDQAGKLTIITDNSDPRLGKNTVKIEKLDDHRSAAIITGKPKLTVKPGETFWLSVWLRGKGVVTPFAIEYSNGKYLYARDLAHYQLDNQWRRLDLEYSVPETSGPDKKKVTDIRFSLHLKPKGVMFIDNFELRKSPEIKMPKPEHLK